MADRLAIAFLLLLLAVVLVAIWQITRLSIVSDCLALAAAHGLDGTGCTR